MEGFQAETYGEITADVYDELHDGRFDLAATVERREELSGGGPALELAVGTGRVALPLAARGIPVDGIDVSPAMVARLREKPGGDAIAVTMGDFADVAVEGRYPLVYVVFNTFFALLTQDDQVRCFANVAEHLTDDGVFVLEAFVPDLASFDSHHQRVSNYGRRLDRVAINAAYLDPSTQVVEGVNTLITEKGIRLLPIVLRYAWPAELDLMARLAGLRLRSRWAGWQKEPFGPDSGSHVSVYGR